jgi:hypothetical protein
MKNIKRALVAILVVTSLISCSEDEPNVNDKDKTNVTDNYYVKYLIKGNGTYGRYSNWTVKTDQGNYTNSGTQVSYWTQTYGPVKKGFICNVQIGNYIDKAPTIEIHISKNQEPFALKVNETGNSASYTIDF